MPSYAHQRKIAERFGVEQPRERIARLAGYTVGPASRLDAEPLIKSYEWLGDIGRATIFEGLFSPQGELHGVACFGYGPAGAVREKLGVERAWCLERGACVHYAPLNAASFLISAACKRVHRQTGVSTFFAYGDPEAGEYGGVYQAAGWVYLGQGFDGTRHRVLRTFVLPPGADPDVASNWKTTRELRRDARRIWDGEEQRWRGLTYAEAEAAGWRIARRGGKHLYATFVGGEPHDRKAWREKHGLLPYPSPLPSLKRKNLFAAIESQCRV